MVSQTQMPAGTRKGVKRMKQDRWGQCMLLWCTQSFPNPVCHMGVHLVYQSFWLLTRSQKPGFFSEILQFLTFSTVWLLNKTCGENLVQVLPISNHLPRPTSSYQLPSKNSLLELSLFQFLHQHQESRTHWLPPWNVMRIDSPVKGLRSPWMKGVDK